MDRKIDFETWLKLVDVEVASRCGLSYMDLPDWRYADAYEDGMSAKTAARRAIRAAGG